MSVAKNKFGYLEEFMEAEMDVTLGYEKNLQNLTYN